MRFRILRIVIWRYPWATGYCQVADLLKMELNVFNLKESVQPLTSIYYGTICDDIKIDSVLNLLHTVFLLEQSC